MLTKKLYEQATGRSQKSNIIAYQIRQSFRPGEITAEEANRIGYELASRFLKGKHAFIVATHTDREHMQSIRLCSPRKKHSTQSTERHGMRCRKS